MIRVRKIVIIGLIVLVTFIISITHFFTKLVQSVGDPTTKRTTEELIYKELLKLKEESHYRNVAVEDNQVDSVIINLNTRNSADNNFEKLWKIANSWVSKSGLVDFHNPHLGSVLYALRTAKIVKADLDTRGTQLKLLLTLEGGQHVVFKPKWYDKNHIIEGPVYAGKDRYGSEIMGFYLSAILNISQTPCSVERNISLSEEVLPVATKRLNETSFKLRNKLCIYGQCFYCKKEDPICEDDNFLLVGAVIFNINSSFKSFRSPWQRTYKENKKALWETSKNYCKNVKEKFTKSRLLDLIDASIFDFLIQNGDRHHYETLDSIILLIDNGKGFGNPNVIHLDILAPLYQCCMLRSDTLHKLQGLQGGVLRKKLENMPQIFNFITKAHLDALEDRLLLVFATVEYCKNKKTQN